MLWLEVLVICFHRVIGGSLMFDASSGADASLGFNLFDLLFLDN